MPFPLHKSPRGLLELFRLRTLGAQPSSFAELVAPVVNVDEFYSSDLLRSDLSNVVGALAPLTVAVVITEPIKLYGLTASFIMGAAGGTQLAVQISINLPATASPAWVVAGNRWQEAALAPAALYPVAVLFPRPLVLPAGARFLAQAFGNAAGADHQINFSRGFATLNPIQ
jgi:hypothetical protein